MPETEAQFERAVVELAQLCGWLDYHTRDSRRSNPGFPDLVLVKGYTLIFAELKTEKGRVSEAQQRWLDALRQLAEPVVGEMTGHSIHVCLWRPSDWDEIRAALAR